jgi:hypothetical protein
MLVVVVVLILLLLLNAGQRHGLHPAGHGRVVCIVGLGHVVPRLPSHSHGPSGGSEGANRGRLAVSWANRASSVVAATAQRAPEGSQWGRRGATLAASPAYVSGREAAVMRAGGGLRRLSAPESRGRSALLGASPWERRAWAAAWAWVSKQATKQPSKQPKQPKQPSVCVQERRGSRWTCGDLPHYLRAPASLYRPSVRPRRRPLRAGIAESLPAHDASRQQQAVLSLACSSGTVAKRHCSSTSHANVSPEAARAAVSNTSASVRLPSSWAAGNRLHLPRSSHL